MKKFKKYQDQRNALEQAIQKVDEIYNSVIPKSAKKIIKESLDKLREIKITPPEMEKVSGDFLDPDRVKELLEDATEYKWKVVKDKEAREHFGIDKDYPPKSLVEENFGIEVDDDEVRFICFYRNTDNRSELCSVDIICIPGHFQCNWANDRASVGNVPMANSKFEKFVKKIR